MGYLIAQKNHGPKPYPLNHAHLSLIMAAMLAAEGMPPPMEAQQQQGVLLPEHLPGKAKQHTQHRGVFSDSFSKRATQLCNAWGWSKGLRSPVLTHVTHTLSGAADSGGPLPDQQCCMSSVTATRA